MVQKQLKVGSNRFVAALLGAMVLSSLADCGGNSMATGAGAAVAVSFRGDTMPSAVAYQAGTTGTFKTLAISGSSVSFALPTGTAAYGFAYVCPTFSAGGVGPFSNESVIRATTTDTTSLSLACPSLPGSVNATFDVAAIPGATSTILYIGSQSNEMSGTSGSQRVSDIPNGTFDVALVAIGAKGALAIQIQRGVKVTSSTSIAFPPMTASDELGNAPATLTNVPAGTTGGFSTTYNTSGGLSAILPVLSKTTPSSYSTVPSSQSQSGDFYLIDAGADLTTQPSESLRALLSSTTASAVTVALPSPSNSLAGPAAAVFPTFNANTSGFSVKGTMVNSSWTQFQTPAGNHTIYNMYTYVTKTWLGANTTFTVPDLSALTGFAPAPPSGQREFWNLYSTAASSLQFLPTQQSGAEILIPPLSVQYIATSGAFIIP